LVLIDYIDLSIYLKAHDTENIIIELLEQIFQFTPQFFSRFIKIEEIRGNPHNKIQNLPHYTVGYGNGQEVITIYIT